MAEFRDSSDIRAPADAVWALLFDVERWPEWTASMRRVTKLEPGPLVEGSRVRVHQPRIPPRVWTVGEAQPGRSFAWTSHSAGISSFADHRITEAGGTCTVELVLRQTGRLAWLSTLGYGRLTRRYLRLETEGLKRRVEDAS